MRETKLIRIIHILMGILIFMIAMVVVFSLSYFGASRWQGDSGEKKVSQGQSEEKSTDKTDREEDTEPEEISSKGKKISIYNGTKINGLAGRWKKKLTTDGYTIEKVANYTESMEKGIILVKEEGMGLDLVREYFPKASVEVGTPEDGVDIQIILGESEDDRE